MMSFNKHGHYLAHAKELSKKSDHHSFHIGCVIVKKNRIVGVGFNSLKTHTRSPHPFRSIHAEFAAVKNAGIENVEDGIVYVFRQLKNGEYANARPCEYCMHFLEQCNVKKIIYSYNNQIQYVEETV